MFGLFISALVYAGAPLGIGTKEVLAATGLRAASGLVAAILGYMPQQSWLGDFLRLTRFVISVPICLTIYLAAVIGVLLVGGPLMLSFSCSGIIATFLVDQSDACQWQRPF
jgi:PST family polysaccharide transporter